MGYQGYEFCNEIKSKFKKTMEIVKRPRKHVRVPENITDVETYLLSIGQSPVQPLKIQTKRWIVERTFAWIGKYRRLSKDYEFNVISSESLIYLAMTRNMLRKIAK